MVGGKLIVKDSTIAESQSDANEHTGDFNFNLFQFEFDDKHHKSNLFFLK